MEFALSSDQRMLQDSVQKLLEKDCPLDVVRAYAAASDSNKNDTALWKSLAQLGAFGVMIDERHGGSGLGLLDAALITQALGAAVAPIAYAGSAVVAPLALQQAGSAKQQAEYLPALAAGELRIANGLYNPHGALSAKGDTLSGHMLFCLDDANAQHYLLAVKDALYLVPRDARGLTITPMPTIDATRPTTELRLENTPAQLLGNGKAHATIARCLLAARICLAADSLGAMQTMLTKARDYALERKQFNRVIGSFQAVKHLCADMAARIEPCHALLWYSAHAFDKQLEDAALTGLLGKAHITDIGKFVARTATEVHGGMGFTDLLGLHYWFKRLGYARQALGSPQELRAQACALQGWG